MAQFGFEQVMQGRRIVIQELDEEGAVIDEVVLSLLQARRAYLGAAAEGHGPDLAPARIRARFSYEERSFLGRHYLRLMDSGVMSGSYWFDDHDAAAWRMAFDRFTPQLLDKAVAVYLPDSRVTGGEPTRHGWDAVLGVSAGGSNLERLLGLAADLDRRGGCFLCVDETGTTYKYYQEMPSPLEVRQEARRGRRVVWWDAGTGERRPV